MNNFKGVKNKVQETKEVCKILFWKNKITASLIYVSLVINLMIWGGLFILTKGEHLILIGHYNVFFGIDILVDLADKSNLWKLFLAPIGGLFFLVVSVLMSIFLILQLDQGSAKQEMKESFVSNRALSFMGSRLLLIGAWLVQLILVIYLAAVWFINK